MVFDRLRTAARESVLFNTAWGYGLALTLVSVIPGVILSGTPTLGNFSALVAAALGVFIAGIVSRTVMRTRIGDRLTTTVIEPALAFVLAFPITAAALTLMHQANDGFPSWLGLLRYFNDQWWAHYAAVGLTYVVAMTICTAVWRYLPKPQAEAFQPWPAARLARRRPREVTAGFILIAFGFAVAFVNMATLTEVARIEIPPLDTKWRTDAARARAVSDILGIRVMPIMIVGLLLLSPRWRRS